MLLRRLALTTAACCAAIAVAGVPAQASNHPTARASTTGPPLTAPEQAPWSVYISVGTDSFCSGSLLDATHVLTAGHCTMNPLTGTKRSPSEYQAYAGLTRNDNSPENTRYQQQGVAALAAHPYYSSKHSSDDVAVLTLSAPFTYSSAVQPIALAPVGTSIPTSADLLVVGWGATRGGDPDAFQHGVVIRRQEREACATGYPGILCAGSAKDAVCPGDSGSGLVLNASAPTRALVGNDSFGASGQRCVVGTPDGFADLSSREIGLWLRGVPNPPRGPRTSHRARAVAHRGHRVACKSPRWKGKPKLKSAFFLSGSKKPVYVGRHRYRVPSKALRRRVTCMVIATNANGTARATSRNYLRFR